MRYVYRLKAAVLALCEPLYLWNARARKEMSERASSETVKGPIAGFRMSLSGCDSQHPAWAHRYFDAYQSMQFRYSRVLCKLLDLQNADPQRAEQLARTYIGEMNFVAQEPEQVESYWAGSYWTRAYW